MDFPRPNPDTGFGFHDSASSYWKPDDYPSYARMLREHGATWFLMWTFDEKKADWARALKQAGIEVIVRLGPAYMPRPNIDMSVVDAYIAAGVRWFVLGNEYNLFNEWETDDNWKGFEKPLRHIADWYVRMADQIRAKGGWPMTPPPALGGHWNHRDWFIRLMTAFQNIAAEQGRSLESLLYPGGIGIHCRSVGNPLTDGPADYDCSAREWEETDREVRRFVGHSLPMANTEWGDEPNWCKRKNPQFDNAQKWNWWKDRNVEQIQWCNPANPGYKYPDYIFANTFWILHSAPPWEDCSLIHNHPYLVEMGGSDITPLWERLPGLVTWNRLGGQPIPPPPEPPQPEPEPEPPGEIEFVGLSEDMIAALSISGPLYPDNLYWKVTRVEIQPETDNQSAFAILDAPTGAARFMWAGGEHVSSIKSDPYAPPGAQSRAASMPLFNSWGAYGVEVYGENSEALFGFGLYGDLPNLEPTHTAHHPVLVYFRLVQPDEPPEPEPEPEPDPDIPYLFILALDARLVASGLAKTVDMRPQIENDYARQGEFGTGSLNEQGLWSITFHHDGSTGPLSVLGTAKYHTDPEPAGRGFPHIAYHFIVGKDGTVWFTKKLDHYSAHCGNSRLNKYSKAVAVHGDLTKEAATPAQLKALRAVVESLEEFVGGGWGQKRGLPILRHKDIVNTACPGNLYEAYRKHLNK